MKKLNSYFHVLMHNYFRHHHKVAHVSHHDFHDLVLISCFIISMFFNLPFMTRAADSLNNASVLISDSGPSSNSSLTFTFNTGTTTPANFGFLDVELPAGQFGAVAFGNITCPAGFGPYVTSANQFGCQAGAAPIASGTKTIVVSSITNPATAGQKIISIRHYNTSDGLSGVPVERVQVAVYIIDGVVMTASVDATLQFAILGMNAGSSVNGVTCNATSTATTTPFGTLSASSTATVCQEIRVSTNASHGFSVTVQQDQELTNANSDTINSFNNAADGTGSTSPTAWAISSGILDQYQTYGHMGFTSADSTLTGGDIFGNALYVGFNGTAPVEILMHTGPADSTTVDKGRSYVAYTTGITALQEAGDYVSNLIYIATPTY